MMEFLHIDGNGSRIRAALCHIVAHNLAATFKLATLCFMLLLSIAANAHKPSDSYLTLTTVQNTVQVRWDVALRDLDTELGLDLDGDGILTWGEIRNRQRDLDAFVLTHLQLRVNGVVCQREPAASTTRLSIDQHSDGAYAVFEYLLICSTSARSLEVEYRLFATTDPTHRGILRIATAATSTSLAAPGSADGTAELVAALDPNAPPRIFTLAKTSYLSTLREFIVEGIWHIWIGFDHILFLLALLLTSVLVPVRHAANNISHAFRGVSWQGTPTLPTAAADMLKIVTAFTVAHSITLTLAVLDLVSLPSRLVESVIAATVILAALNNLMPVLQKRRWMATFFFGLVHGFGFAGTLKSLGLPIDALGWSLFGFNVGVEIGQLAIVSVFFPLAYWLRNGAFYRRGVLTGGSVLITLIAVVWLVERAFDLKLITT